MRIAIGSEELDDRLFELGLREFYESVEGDSQFPLGVQDSLETS